MVMIIVYAIWMGIEADWNDALLITEPWHRKEDASVVQLLGLWPVVMQLPFGRVLTIVGVPRGPASCHGKISCDSPAFCSHRSSSHCGCQDASAIFQLAEHFFCPALSGMPSLANVGSAHVANGICKPMVEAKLIRVGHV
eukprot:Skav227163  [mRNA]  locus=scaffold502:216786:217205:- [translate_table: standard]